MLAVAFRILDRRQRRFDTSFRGADRKKLAAMNNFSENSTFFFAAHWSFYPVWSLTIWILVLLCNGVAVGAFLKDRGLRAEPFNVYLISLLLSNLVFGSLQNPLDLITSLYQSWWLGEKWCIFHLYGTVFFSAVPISFHALISASRVWAMAFPISYRRYHSRKLAILLCGFVLTYVHGIQLSPFLTSVQGFRAPFELYGCRHQYIRSDIAQYALYVFPEVFMLVAYPIVLHKRSLRRRTTLLGDFTVSVRNEQNLTQVTQKSFGARRKKAARETHAFLVLTLLTASVFVCWTPATILFLLETYVPGQYGQYVAIFLPVFFIQPLLDPFLFAAALSELRKSIYLMFIT